MDHTEYRRCYGMWTGYSRRIQSKWISMRKLYGVIGVLWGLMGIFTLLIFAIYRLSSIALDAFSYDFFWYHWLVLIGNTLFMAHSEGYRGFQLNFSPRVAARLKSLFEFPTFLHVITAPFYCIGYYHIKRSKQLLIIGLTTGILILVYLIRFMPQPWRGIIDVGVVVGLSWGVVTLFIFCIMAFTSKHFNYSPDNLEK